MPNTGLDPYDCDCGWLQQAANDSSVPVGFDSATNEYYLRVGTRAEVEARYVIRYCPNCGGDAPVSHRETLFEVITPEEHMRLRTLWSNLHTRDDVLRAWGPPDEVIPQGYSEGQPERPGEPKRTVNFDVMRYNKVSPAAVMDVILCAGERVMFTYYTKPKQP